MNSMNSSSKLLVAAALGAALAACNAVEDVREAPFTPVPTEKVVLQGKVTGTLGKQRSVTLMNNGDGDHAISVSATLGTAFTPFTFGAVDKGSPYSITVKLQPFGKICTVTGGTGTVTTPEAMNVVVNCVNNSAVPRYNLRVALPASPAAFTGLAGAKVTLTTEEGVYEQTPASGATFVQFDNVLFNNVVGGTVWGQATTATTPTAGGGPLITNIIGGTVNSPTFSWAVSASTTVGSTSTTTIVNKCAVSAGANFTGSATGLPTPNPTPNFNGVGLPPTGNIGFLTSQPTQTPTVGACAFTIGGSGAAGPAGVYYAAPPSSPGVTMPAGGLDLQLRDVQGNVVETLTYTGGYGASGTATGTTPSTVGAAYTFATSGRSNSSAVYDVAVSRQPTGQTCLVHNGGQATLGVATANISNMHVACRAIPAVANRLRGTYGFLNGTAYNAPNPVTPVNTLTTIVEPSGTTITTVSATTVNTRTTYLSTTNPGLGGASTGQTVVSDFLNQTRVTFTPTGSPLPPAFPAPPVAPSVIVSDTGSVPSLAVTSNINRFTRNVLTFFEDGTFLHGVHTDAGTQAASTGQIEHGFYDYNPVTRKIVFTIITDTSAGGTSSLLSTGLSGTGGVVTTAGLPTATMSNVVKSTVGATGRISGDFAFVGTPAGTPALLPVAYGTLTQGSRWATWVLAEPQTVAGQVTGTWVTRDHRQIWNYDFNTTLGFHAGVSGAASNLQDGCFTFDNYRVPAGFYTRRGGVTGCLNGVFGTVDVPSAGSGTPSTLGSLPGFVGRMPGSETAADGRSPSPIYYAIGTSATFASIADPAFFPAATVTPAALAWCTTEIFGVRSSLNGNPINQPVYFCRERAN